MFFLFRTNINYAKLSNKFAYVILEVYFWCMNELQKYQKVAETFFIDVDKSKQLFIKLSNNERNNFLLFVYAHYRYHSLKIITYFRTLNSKEKTKEKKRIAFNKRIMKEQKLLSKNKCKPNIEVVKLQPLKSDCYSIVANDIF